MLAACALIPGEMIKHTTICACAPGDHLISLGLPDSYDNNAHKILAGGTLNPQAMTLQRCVAYGHLPFQKSWYNTFKINKHNYCLLLCRWIRVCCEIMNNNYMYHEYTWFRVIKKIVPAIPSISAGQFYVLRTNIVLRQHQQNDRKSLYLCRHQWNKSLFSQ